MRSHDAPAARASARFSADLLALEADRVLPLGPRSERKTEQSLVDVVRDDVVEWGGVVTDDQDDDADGVRRHERYLRVEAVDVAPVIREQVSAIRGGVTGHAVHG